MNKAIFGLSANDRVFEDYVDLEIPTADTAGKFPTLNNTGLMTHDRDPFSDNCIEFSEHCKFPVLEIGTAYGISTLPLLDQGGVVVANDVCFEHLAILRNRTPTDQRKNLFLNAKSFPDETDFPDDSFDAILICRVAHLFTPAAMEESLDKILRWIRPKGRIYITSMTPHHHGLKDFLPVYNQRWEQGDLWPGVIENFHEYFPENKTVLPQYAHMMDERPLLEALKRKGFVVVKDAYYDYVRPNASERTEKEYYGVVATKE